MRELHWGVFIQDVLQRDEIGALAEQCRGLRLVPGMSDGINRPSTRREGREKKPISYRVFLEEGSPSVSDRSLPPPTPRCAE